MGGLVVGRLDVRCGALCHSLIDSGALIPPALITDPATHFTKDPDSSFPSRPRLQSHHAKRPPGPVNVLITWLLFLCHRYGICTISLNPVRPRYNPGMSLNRAALV